MLLIGQRPALTDPIFLAAASELAQFDVLQPQASMTLCAPPRCDECDVLYCVDAVAGTALFPCNH